MNRKQILKNRKIEELERDLREYALIQQKVERDFIIEKMKIKLMVFEDKEGSSTSFRWTEPYWLGYRQCLHDLLKEIK